MFVVRYPDGTAITYNTANYLVYEKHAWVLRTKKDGGWVASIQLSAGATVECVTACKVERPEDQVSLATLVERVVERLKEDRRRGSYLDWSLRKHVNNLKRLLSRCDMRGGRWR